MTINCFIVLSTSDGVGCAEIRVTSLLQLARLMPAQVVRYVVEEKGPSMYAPVTDGELYDLLVGVIRDIDPGQRH